MSGAFELTLTVVVGAIGVVNLLGAAILNHMLQELRSHRALHDEKDYLPRADFDAHDRENRKLRHDMKEDIEDIKVRLGPKET